MNPRHLQTVHKSFSFGSEVEQLQQEMEEMRKSKAQAEASSVEKDKQLAQAKEQADHAMQQLKKQQEAAGDKAVAMRRAVCKRCLYAVDGVESRYVSE